MNIASLLRDQSKQRPSKKAVVFPQKSLRGNYTYRHLTFSELEDLSNFYAFILKKEGLEIGHKVLLFVRPSLDFTALTFALYKIGAVPILIDPGMGKKNLLNSISQVEPIALIAVQEVHLIRQFYPESFKSCKKFISTGTLPLPETQTLHSLKAKWIDDFTNSPLFSIEERQPQDIASILFTSGGTGAPKGVAYTQKIFASQVRMLREMFALTPDEVDLPGFPLFSLLTVAIGMTSCIPDMNPSKPAQANPKKLIQNIQDQKVTFAAGSPAIWERVADYCLKNSILLPSIKYLVMFGAPVSNQIHEKFKNILPNGTTYTPYGATESLPLCNFSGREILKTTAKLTDKGKGTCVGKPTPGISLKIIPITDEVLPFFEDLTFLPSWQIGEIIVSGDVVTPEYYNMPQKTAEAKIVQKEGILWHRMGDLGYLDEEGKLWFCGRKTHKVTTSQQELYSIPCEAIFNAHPEVKRSALIQTRKNNEPTASIVIERKDQKILKGKKKILFEKELLQLAKEFEHTQSIKDIYLYKSFPVDVRHNIKIDRLKLREVAEKRTCL